MFKAREQLMPGYNIVETTSYGGKHIRICDINPTRNLKTCFKDKEKIYHKIRFNDGSDSTICCIYNETRNCLLFKDKIYRSLDRWCKDHKRSANPIRDKNDTDAWGECKIWNEEHKKWISVNKIYKREGWNNYIKIY
jgi:hypothetical protein|tara:strand:+ start:164 stop:574 length:411 start_codon:yes stop_codon:yes gene_type:complete